MPGGPPLGTINNPLGKGGFQERPDDIAKGGHWGADTSISYQYNVLIRLSVNDFMKWIEEHPKDQRTLAQEMAYNAVVKARDDLSYLKEVTDRTEGKAPQTVTMQGGFFNETKLVIEEVENKPIEAIEAEEVKEIE